MRIDKYLKVSRIIKRRTVAQQACDAGRVTLNGRVAKPSSEVNVGDVLTLQLGEKVSTYEVLSLKEHVQKDDAALLFKRIEGADGHADRTWV